jgi:hypothetical protein
VSPSEILCTRACICETHVLFEFKGLVHLAWESIDEEATFTVFPALAGLGHEGGIHRVLEQLDGDLHRHNLSLTDVLSDKVAKLRVRSVLLSTQEVASGEVREVVLLYKKAALCSFPYPGKNLD